MPITEAPLVDERTEFVRLLVEWVKDEFGNPMYAEMHERQVAETAAREARRARMSAMGKARKGHHHPGSRPYLAAGFKTRQSWIDAGSPPPTGVNP